MALLNKKFDVLRGWPREGALDESFKAQIVAGVPAALPQGSVVAQQADGSVNLATTVNRATVNGVPTWVVVEGNDDFSGTFTGKVVVLRANAELRLDPANFIAGTYNPGTALSFSAGKFQPAVTGNQIIGDVISDDRAIDGTLKIYYSGGLAGAL